MRSRYLAIPMFVLGVSLLAGTPTVLGQETAKKTVSLTVLVPQDDAILVVDDKKMEQRGVSRLYTSPPLDPAGKFTYTVKVTWEPNNYTKITRTQKVKIEPAKDANLKVDMTTEDPRWKDDIVVRFVPTPKEVVDAMCKLAKVGKEDVVYDLGCGDGVMVIRAVEKFAAKRGVGIDLDPVRVKESQENAIKAKVADKVAFREGDVLKIDDIPDASVVLLYMGNDINLRLRPILQAKLKPGSRIVSHRFTMGDWAPTETETVTVGGTEYQIHLWIVGDHKK